MAPKNPTFVPAIKDAPKKPKAAPPALELPTTDSSPSSSKDKVPASSSTDAPKKPETPKTPNMLAKEDLMQMLFPKRMVTTV